MKELPKDDYSRLWYDLIKHKALFIVVIPIVLVCSIIYAYSLPSTYKAEVTLAPETKTGSISLATYTLAGRFGYNIFKRGTEEAIYPKLYPDIVNSLEFKKDILACKVHRENDTTVCSYYEYLLNDRSKPWWSEIFGKKKERTTPLDIDLFRLTPDQYEFLELFGYSVFCKVDRRTNVVTLSVIDQDPYISAILVDSARCLLQKYVIDYRAKKARQNVAYYEKLRNEAKEKYGKSSAKYSKFADSNRDLQTESAKSQLKELEENMQRDFKAYNQYTLSYIEAENQAQEAKPIFAVLHSASIPNLAYGPKKIPLLLTNLLIAIVLLSLFVYYREKDLKLLLLWYEIKLSSDSRSIRSLERLLNRIF